MKKTYQTKYELTSNDINQMKDKTFDEIDELMQRRLATKIINSLSINEIRKMFAFSKKLDTGGSSIHITNEEEKFIRKRFEDNDNQNVYQDRIIYNGKLTIETDE